VLGVDLGTAAPEFVAQTIDAQRIQLASCRGKVVLIDFWATWCAPCVAELPHIKRAYEKYADEGLVIIGISFDRDAETVRRFVTRHQLPWPQIWAEHGNKNPLAIAYGVGGIPANFLIDPYGKLIAKDLRGQKFLQAVEKEINLLGDR